MFDYLDHGLYFYMYVEIRPPFSGHYSMEVTFLHRNLTDIVYIM